MAVGTIMPSPKFTGFDQDGDPLSGGLLYTYAAGTSTALATYSDVGLTTANANPVVLDSAGRATIFLTAASYKFVLTDSLGSIVWTQDNIGAVLGTTVDLDVTGTAGENLLAGDAVYLSDGSGTLTATRWYKTDSDVPYASSALMIVGMVPFDLDQGDSGTIRVSGRMTGLSGLTAGSAYYLSSTAGGITATAPSNRRFIGIADSLTSLVLSQNPPPPQDPWRCDGRLTLTSGTAITSSDVTAATSVYFTPYRGNHIALYDGTRWTTYTFTERTLSLAAFAANTNYDVFLYDNAGTLTLESLAWSSDTARATAVVVQDGIYVKTGATTRRYLGTFRTTGTIGQTEDSITKRYLWNSWHRALRLMRVLETTNTWTYTTAIWRQANGSTANQVSLVQGLAEEALTLDVFALAQNSTSAVEYGVGIGEDSTTAPHASSIRSGELTSQASSHPSAHLVLVPSEGKHDYAWLEYSAAAGATNWYGDNGGVINQAGLYALWRA